MPINKAAEGLKLYYIKRANRWSKGIGAELPEAYKKFWKEWKIQEPVAVHYIKQEGMFTRNELTGEIKPVQNIPIQVKYPKEHNEGIWGGEGVVQGYQKRHPLRRRVPHFWVPVLKRSVVYSEVLNKYMSVVVTERTLRLIHEHYGFDHYLLKTPACDLKSELALKIKRQILHALAGKTLYKDDPVRQEDVYAKYEQYLAPYTKEEIEWYGLTYAAACKKWLQKQEEIKKPKPLKLQYRSELITKLKEHGIAEAMSAEISDPQSSTQSSWMSKINPFSKSPKA